MIQDPLVYFKENNLFNWDNLKTHCIQHNVNIAQSKWHPNLALLHYNDTCQFDKLWTDFSRISRGLIVDMANKNILAHPYHKFHNLNEVPETAYDNLKDKKEFEISEKLDGSMLISYIDPNDGQIYLTTKGSFDSEHGQVGTELFRNHPNYNRFVAYVKNGTLMFELIDPRFRIVIDYSKKNYSNGLYLIGYRTNEGKLFKYADVALIGKLLGLETPKAYQFDSLDQLLGKTEALTIDEEGFVIRYKEDNLMVKVKGLKYLQAHRFISRLSDSNLLEAIGEGSINELINVCPEEYKDEIILKVADFNQSIVNLQNKCYSYFNDAPKNTRKDFAIWVNCTVESYLRGFVFSIFDNKPLNKKALCEVIKERDEVSSQSRI